MADFATNIQSLIGKVVEVYQSVEHNNHNYAEYVTSNKSVLIGKLLAADGECLKIECVAYKEKGRPNKKIIVYVNVWTITSVAEIKDDLSLFDAYWSSEEVAKALKRGEKFNGK